MSQIKLIQGDITKLTIDVIVNAANTSLLGGGGVDGAIHRAGGSAILEECVAIRNKQGGCETGEAVLTTAGKLNAKYIIHAVGPVWNGGTKQEPLLLAKAYQNSLRIAVANNCKSVAFPNISTGIYGFPKQLAAEIAIAEVKKKLVINPFLSVTFCCFDIENYTIYEKML
jgi:O-acetyl-ADP-ribose deacetylase (regulator of RNase III)